MYQGCQLRRGAGNRTKMTPAAASVLGFKLVQAGSSWFELMIEHGQYGI
jgi:hypothetical protein